ncbi:MAG TPA: zinc-binding dehydrogenase [Firmicutes bacterium]|nr:zinc-binding dehydrogenase [Bacillota bacterium]
MKTMNKMAMCYGNFDLRIEEHPIDEPRPGEVQLAIKAALTCGTDVKIYKRGYPFLKPPFPVGHEYAGEVIAVGEGVDPALVGKGVVTSNGAGCQFCFYCKRDQDNLCEGSEADFDQYVQMGGGFAQYINVHAPIVQQNLKVMPEGMSYEQAAMVEPLSVALHGINMADIKIGDTVAIIGAGPMGLLQTQLAKLRGARVISIEKNRERLEQAGKMGADVLVCPDDEEDVVKAVRSCANGGRGPDRVIEAVGLPQTWELAIALARKGGTVVEYGGCASGTTITVDTKRLHYDELTIKGSYSATAYETEVAFDLLARGVIRAADYISGVYPLERTKEALDAHLNQKGIKFEIKP